MSLRDFKGRSMVDLKVSGCDDDEEEEDEMTLKPGLLRRAFSSRKKKKNKNHSRSPLPSPGLLSPHRDLRPPSPNFGGNGQQHKPLRACRSNPMDGKQPSDSSPASDLAARRGVFSRRHYGSVELLIATDTDGQAQNAGRFRVETGEREQDEILHSPIHAPVHLENPEFQTRWYFKYFLGKLHQNYVGADMEREPFFLSVVVTDANNHSVPQYRAILWRRTGNQKICLPYNPNKPLTVKSILSTFGLEKVDKGPKEIFNPDVQQELLVLEEQEGSVNFKFGVIFAKEGQVSDDEMYSNEHGSEDFDKFNYLLGDRIRLKGWEKFKGGLDNKSDMTGTEAVHTVYEGHEIIFHISTMLPFTADNPQQVERKRHVGNDIVNIVFYEVDGDYLPAFRPSMMKTHFTHIYAVVAYNKQNDTYRIAVFSEESVPLFGPALMCPPVFSDHQEFRDLLLVKLINGEKAAFNVPVFAQKRQRTLEMLIRNMYQDYIPDTAKNNMLNRRAFSDLIPENVHGPRRKEEARQLEFLRVGQSLKLKIILRGDAPTSLASSGALLKHQPWEPQCFLHELQHDVVCGDSWGDKLVVVTSGGTLLLEEGARPRVLFDKTIVIKQMNVIEAHGILVFRAEKGRESRVHVFRLSDFEGEKNEATMKTKTDLKEHKMERTKGCHLYNVSRAGASHLRLIVAVAKRLMVFVWRHSSAWSVWYPLSDNDVVEGFQFVRELQSFETPHLMSLVDGCQDQDNQICVGYKNQFDLINEKNGDTLQLHKVDASKSNLVAALDIYEDDEAELLLCYNHVSHFQKLREDNSQEFDFYWNSEPKGIVCAFPYILAFTPDTIEIRLIINGNLVHTMTMPDLQLITSKCDIYFVSSATISCGYSPTKFGESAFFASPPSSPSSSTSTPLNIFKIPLSCLVGQISNEKPIASSPSTQPQHTMLSPLVNPSEACWQQSPSSSKRSPFLRTKRMGPFGHFPSEDLSRRHDSNSSCSGDSGIHLNRHAELSPPVSPFYLSASLDDEESAIV